MTIRLDIHAHLAPIPPRARMTDGVAWDNGQNVLVIDGHPVGMRPLFDPPALIRWMDDNQVQNTWISIPPPLYRQQLEGAVAEAWSDTINEGLQTIAAGDADRLLALVHLPMELPALAAAIARKWIARGHTRFSAPAGGTKGQMISDPAYTPLWDTLNEAGAFLLLHPGDSPDPRVSPFYLANLLGNPYETTLAACHLVYGGILASHPDILFCLAHGGGMTAVLAGRLAQGFITKRPGLDMSLPPPRDLLKRLWVDTILHDDGAVGLAEQIFGPDHIVFGTDWPFPMGLMTPHTQLAGLSPAQQDRMLRTNPETLLTKGAR